MPRILLIETASEVSSAAIAIDGRVVALEEDLHCQSHAAQLTVQIEACSKGAGIPLASLDAVAVSQGPGAYTSLRVGASVAKGICYALGKPLIAIDTLLTLAWAARSWYLNVQEGTKPVVLVPALDARRQEIWTALYDADLQLLAPTQSLVLENNSFENYIQRGAVPDILAGAVIAGNGSEKIRSGLNLDFPVFFPEIMCSAQHLSDFAEKYFQSADFQDVAYFEPFYMKLPNITTPKKNIF